tara:strand:- start:4028 stop:4210 length:183 start_codon:yes stop_codon:yes gene_type:complete
MPVEKKTHKGSSPKVYNYFKVDGDKISRIKKNCSRCGKGIYMAEHKDRRTCGQCNNTEFI